MNTQTFTYLLEHPENITATQTAEIRGIVDEFPYFQSAHALYLKGLKNQDSFSYNKALKITAAHTTDRDVLFDYITSKVFTQNDISTQIKDQDSHLKALAITGMQDVSLQVEKEEQHKANQILDPNLFVEKVDSDMTKATPLEVLSIGKPLEFKGNETYSFGEWLKLAAFKPIDRSKSVEPTDDKEIPKETEIVKSTLSRKRKQEIIDSFMKTSPKIQTPLPSKQEKRNLAKESLIPQEALMTETLARVYVEQKNYKKAKQAYRILSLKYPEKSGFFADQIRAVEQLEVNKEL